MATSSPEKQLSNAATQIQTHLKSAVHTAELDALAAYYTLTQPQVRGLPFCVALANSTFLFHMQMEKVTEADTEVYVQLVSKVCSLISPSMHTSHPFMMSVLRQSVYGLPAIHNQTGGSAHAVVLLAPAQYRAFSYLAAELAQRDAIPLSLLSVWRQHIQQYVSCRSTLVSLRAQTLLVRTSTHAENDRDLSELQTVIQSNPTKMNVDHLLLCYERLQRLVPDAANGNYHGRSLSIVSTQIFLKLRSPIRRHYVEHYLYPSLAAADTAHFLDHPATRRHLVSLLLRQCTPSMVPGNPYYMCLCAIVQKELVGADQAAVELATLMDYQMPHASYFISALAIDPHMSQELFVKMLMVLVRGAAHVMAGHNPDDNCIASAVNNKTTMVYNILFTLRDVVRQVSSCGNKHSVELLSILRRNVRSETTQALGTYATQAFDGRCDVEIEPHHLCAELDMILHDAHVEDAIDLCVAFVENAATTCRHCGAPNASSVICHVSGMVHLNDRNVCSRLLSTIADCTASRVVVRKLTALLTNATTQMSPAVHILVNHLIVNAGPNKASLCEALQPHVGGLLIKVVDGDRMGSLPSDVKGSVLMLVTKMVQHVPCDPAKLQVSLKAMSQLSVRSEHDALVLWNVAHRLLRVGKANVELLPLDPSENNYGADTAIAPTFFAAADNAQLLLRILSKVHSFNSVTRKLVGCSTCKLVQDFNMQASNVYTSLLDDFGCVPATLASLGEFAFPVSPDSTFWRFMIGMVKKSAASRTAFLTSLARCFGHRFRVERPQSAITVGGRDSAGHIFAVAAFECLRNHAAFSRIVSYVLSHWIRQRGHQPGKFVCLAYMCVQLFYATSNRRGSSLTTPDDERLFEESSTEGSVVLGEISEDTHNLLSVVSDNPQFYNLLCRMSESVSVAVGKDAPALNSYVPDDAVFNNIDSEFGAAFNESLREEIPHVRMQNVVAHEDADFFPDNNDGPAGDDDDFSSRTSSAPPAMRKRTAAVSFAEAPEVYPADSWSSVTPSASTHTIVSTANHSATEEAMWAEASRIHINPPLQYHPSRHPQGLPHSVEMPLPQYDRDEATQTSSSPIDPRLPPNHPVQQQHANKSFAAPSVLILDYLLKQQGRNSTLEGLKGAQQRQDAEEEEDEERADGGDAQISNGPVFAISMDPDNSYHQPHMPSRPNAPSRSVLASLSMINNGMAPPPMLGEKRLRDAQDGRGATPPPALRQHHQQPPVAPSVASHNSLQRIQILSTTAAAAVASQKGGQTIQGLRQAMGTANPNTIHNFNGQLRREKPGSNVSYNKETASAGWARPQFVPAYAEDARYRVDV